MIIQIKRIFVKGEVTEGHLRIDGLQVCDTLENTFTCLSPGEYPVTLVKCKQYHRKMIIIGDTAPCEDCHQLKEVYSNTLMPRHCPMIKPGNGIHGRHDGSILVGTRSSLGCIIHPKSAFDTLSERIRKNLERRREVTLVIEE